MMSKRIVPIAVAEKLLRTTGAERISLKAKTMLCTELERIGTELGRRAARLSRHAGRKTVNHTDVEEATRQYLPARL